MFHRLLTQPEVWLGSDQRMRHVAATRSTEAEARQAQQRVPSWKMSHQDDHPHSMRVLQTICESPHTTSFLLFWGSILTERCIW